MFLPPFFWVPFLLLSVLGAGCLGALSGWLTALACGHKARWKADAALAIGAFLLCGLATILMPWPTNTVTETWSAGTVSTTTERYQHPERVAAVGALLVPLLYEVRRKGRRGA